MKFRNVKIMDHWKSINILDRASATILKPVREQLDKMRSKSTPNDAGGIMPKYIEGLYGKIKVPDDDEGKQIVWKYWIRRITRFAIFYAAGVVLYGISAFLVDHTWREAASILLIIAAYHCCERA